MSHLEQRSTTSKAVLQQKPSKRRANDEEIVPFEQIVGGLPHYEVCRMFLASLQLANNGNVQLVHATAAADQIKVPFQMQLLTTASCYESIQNASA